MRTTGKQCGLAATGVYQPSLRSPWLAAKEVDPDRLKKTIVVVKHEEKPGRLLLDRRPSQEGLAWVKYEMDGQEVEVDLLAVELVAFMEA
ncbi:transcriptional repressor KorB C-terminal beta-barrel domain-containing protein [Thiolapillus sp.]|uniref:transcriptional repressor KorB C-terminal beta-barrel domain-containing protein n=1 Tax=Thiolapillus sp. TaxID=2017437 RepID=UPI0025E2736C